MALKIESPTANLICLQLAKCADQIEEQQQALEDLEQRHRAEFEACQAAERRVEVLEILTANQQALINEVLTAFKLEPDGSCINPGRDFIRPWAEKVAALNPTAEGGGGDWNDRIEKLGSAFLE